MTNTPVLEPAPIAPVPEDVASKNLVIVGGIGSGKTVTAKGFVEVLLAILARRRVVIMDPTGVWWGLRYKADESPGFKIAHVGGEFGDFPLAADAGEVLARYVATSDDSIIIDLSEMTSGDRIRFSTEFFRHLYDLNRRPLYLIVDEADEFAPQNPMPESKRMLHHFDRIVRRGRVRGFRVCMITQRPAVLHKNVMSQAKAIIAMNLLGSQDRAAVQLWINGQGDLERGREVLNTLARLQLGEGWLWAPQLDILQRQRFPMISTMDSSKTPEDDEPALEPPEQRSYVGAFPELERVLAGLPRSEHGGDLEERPRKRSAARRENVSDEALRIEREGIEREAYQAGHRVGFDQGYAAASSAIAGKIAAVLTGGEQMLEQLREISKSIDEMPPTLVIAAGPASKLRSKPLQRSALLIDPEPPTPSILEHPDGADSQTRKLPSSVRESGFIAPRRISAKGASPNGPSAGNALLQAFATFPERRLTWGEACILARMENGNGHFYGGRKWLIENKLIDADAASGQITANGLKRLGGRIPEIPTLAHVVDAWAERVKKPGGEMLRAIAADGGDVTELALARTLRKTLGNGHWYGGIKALRKPGLIEQDDGRVRLSPFLQSLARK
jgi:ABC-type dipeptide/oligopeptide/nickel transport system ATPase component